MHVKKKIPFATPFDTGCPGHPALSSVDQVRPHERTGLLNVHPRITLPDPNCAQGCCIAAPCIANSGFRRDIGRRVTVSVRHVSGATGLCGWCYSDRLHRPIKLWKIGGSKLPQKHPAKTRPPGCHDGRSRAAENFVDDGGLFAPCACMTTPDLKITHSAATNLFISIKFI